MSQRSALSAAASATALVSEPPRPKVLMRLSGPSPWNPATTATSPCSIRAFSPSTATPVIRAARWAPSVTTGICQPCHDRAGYADRLEHEGQQPGGDLLAGGHHGVIFARVMAAVAGAPFRSARRLKPQASSTQATS